MGDRGLTALFDVEEARSVNLISDEQQAAFDQRQRERRVAMGLPETIQDPDFLRLFAAVVVAQQRRDNSD